MDERHIGTAVLDCLRDEDSATKRERLREWTPDHWQAIARLAIKTGVAPALYQRLKPLGGRHVPAEVEWQLRAATLQAATHNTRFYHQLEPVLAALHSAGIPVVALKGIYLAQHVYTHVAERTFGDADILVPEVDLPRTAGILERLGYVPRVAHITVTEYAHHLIHLHPQHGLCIETHWNLYNAHDGFTIDLPAVWARAQPVTIANTPALALSPEDVLAHLCLHSAYHAYEVGPRTILDVAQVIRRFAGRLDWQVLTQRVIEWRVNKSAFMMLSLTNEYLGTGVPQEILSCIKPASWDDRWLELARTQVLGNGESASAPQLAQVWGPKTIRQRMGILFYSLFLPRKMMATMYPASEDSPALCLYYPARWLRLVRLYGQTAWKLLRGDPAARARAARQSSVLNLREWLISH